MSIVLTTAAPGSPAWLAAREGRIGGTAAVNVMLGADPEARTFGTPFTEYLRLTGRMTKDAMADATEELKRILKWGQNSEPLHREMLAEETGGTFSGPPGVLQHDSIPWLAVSPDGRCNLPLREGREEYGVGSIELKAPTRFTVDEWDEGVPLTYQVQSAAIMCVENTPWCLTSALVPPSVRYGIVKRDAAFEQHMLDTLGHFMEHHVLKDIPPPVTWREVDKKALYRLHPKDDGSTAELDRSLIEAFDTLADRKERAGAIEKALDEVSNQIKQAIGGATFAICGPWTATFKTQERNVHCKHCGALNSHSEFRVLRTKKG